MNNNKTKEDIKVFDKVIIEFICREQYKIFIVLISILAFMLRYYLFNFTSKDYNDFLLNWCMYLENNGGLAGIKSISSDYNVTYLYILSIFTYLPFSYLTKIKLLSISFDFLGAILSTLIVKHICRNEKDPKNAKLIPLITYAIILSMPTVIINSSLWGQCDIIYTTFVLGALYFILLKRYNISFILYGIALALKIQSVIILPLYIILYLKEKKFSIINFIIIPIINLILYIPAWILGRPISKIFLPYLIQITEYKENVISFSNIYNWLPNNYNLFSKPGIFFTFIILGILTMVILNQSSEISNSEVILLTIVLIMVTTYFLPGMHDRYIFMADILSVIYYIITRRKVIIPITITILSFNCYMLSLFLIVLIPMKIAAAVQLILIIVIIGEYFYGERKN